MASGYTSARATYYPLSRLTGICVCDVEMYTPPKLRSQSQVVNILCPAQPQVISSQLSSTHVQPRRIPFVISVRGGARARERGAGFLSVMACFRQLTSYAATMFAR